MHCPFWSHRTTCGWEREPSRTPAGGFPEREEDAVGGGSAANEGKVVAEKMGNGGRKDPEPTAQHSLQARGKFARKGNCKGAQGGGQGAQGLSAVKCFLLWQNIHDKLYHFHYF